ncbi:HrpE/YscL family type III secretion apparatus protein [Marinomonas balearica]|uniref:Flagellar biosynthesis/type III secretory pathway protein FliH n=1 Tax=Marinomonas balearica TaxID=491947 RepID=A0A4V6PTT1_9GAMM|nr:HrpE/YscL family type III secretion apparatus protein [Marinomonas balearica]TDO96332.1 flagellar biosynthesis/type III secretory pathway protein FliH [Marinomonas balearica]
MSSFVRRSVSLPSYSTNRNIITREETESVLKSIDIIAEAEAKAHNQAALIIESAQLEAQTIMDHAEQNAHIQANNIKETLEADAFENIQRFLEETKTANDKIWDEIEHHANTVVNEVIQTFLGKVSSIDKVSILVDKVVSMHRDKSLATLYCSPTLVGEVESTLGNGANDHLCVRPDDNLSEEEVKLVSGMGEFYVTWRNIQAALLGGADETSCDSYSPAIQLNDG